ncbi:hypothetical protein ALC53_06451 [Atta colombica]|uniref:Uncharacterized protein n=1 Tax=Atta colombica TaxID=520822 RepID=A0A195BF33_9HYME|nr:hypothetical protein ALC53_06451 [Atta colombica]
MYFNIDRHSQGVLTTAREQAATVVVAAILIPITNTLPQRTVTVSLDTLSLWIDQNQIR